MEFINNLKVERSGKKIDVELLEGQLADDVRCVVCHHYSALSHNVKLTQRHWLFKFPLRASSRSAMRQEGDSAFENLFQKFFLGHTRPELG